MKKLIFLAIPLTVCLLSYALLENVADTVGQAVEGAGEVAEGGVRTAAGVATFQEPEIEEGLGEMAYGTEDIATSPANLAPYGYGYDYEPDYGYDEDYYDDNGLAYVGAGYYGDGYYGDGYGRGRGRFARGARGEGFRHDGGRGGFRGGAASRGGGRGGRR